MSENTAVGHQVGGDHYIDMGDYQPVHIMQRWLSPQEFRGWAKGTALAYIAREADKGGDEDLAKAAHVLQLYLELV